MPVIQCPQCRGSIQDDGNTPAALVACPYCQRQFRLPAPPAIRPPPPPPRMAARSPIRAAAAAPPLSTAVTASYQMHTHDHRFGSAHAPKETLLQSFSVFFGAAGGIVAAILAFKVIMVLLIVMGIAMLLVASCVMRPFLPDPQELQRRLDEPPAAAGYRLAGARVAKGKNSPPKQSAKKTRPTKSKSKKATKNLPPLRSTMGRRSDAALMQLDRIGKGQWGPASEDDVRRLAGKVPAMPDRVTEAAIDDWFAQNQPANVKRLFLEATHAYPDGRIRWEVEFEREGDLLGKRVTVRFASMFFVKKGKITGEIVKVLPVESYAPRSQSP